MKPEYCTRRLARGRSLGGIQVQGFLNRARVSLSTACMILAIAVSAIAPGAAAAATKNATLIHVGPSGLESYNAWTRRSTTLVPGMDGDWGSPFVSPNGICAVTLQAGRSDRGWSGAVYGAELGRSAVELTVTDPDDGYRQDSQLLGWLDDYTAVIQQYWNPFDPDGDGIRIKRDIRTGDWDYYDGPVKYPASARARTSGDKKYSISVSRSQIMTIRNRKTRKRIARFKVPGSGNGKSTTGWYYSDASISPDGKFVAYQLWRTPDNSAWVTWRTYLCTTDGKKAKRIKNDNGGLVWAAKSDDPLDRLLPGDVILLSNSSDSFFQDQQRLYGAYFTHAMIYVGERASGHLVVEATSPGHVSRISPLEGRSFGIYQIVRVKGATTTDRAAAARVAEKVFVQVPYGWSSSLDLLSVRAGLDKTRLDRLYCSSLVWNAWFRGGGVDLDSDWVDMSGTFGGVLNAPKSYYVMPDDIARSDRVEHIYNVPLNLAVTQ